MTFWSGPYRRRRWRDLFSTTSIGSQVEALHRSIGPPFWLRVTSYSHTCLPTIGHVFPSIRMCLGACRRNWVGFDKTWVEPTMGFYRPTGFGPTTSFWLVYCYWSLHLVVKNNIMKVISFKYISSTNQSSMFAYDNTDKFVFLHPWA